MAVDLEMFPLRFEAWVRPWRYSVSHRTLILRGADATTWAEKVDLHFIDVLGMKLRTSFKPLVISAGGDRTDIAEFVDVPARHAEKYATLLLSDGVHEGFVVCAAFRIAPAGG